MFQPKTKAYQKFMAQQTASGHKGEPVVLDKTRKLLLTIQTADFPLKKKKRNRRIVNPRNSHTMPPKPEGTHAVFSRDL